MDDLFEIDIKLKKVENTNDQYKGEFYLKAKETIVIEKMAVQLMQNIKEKGVPTIVSKVPVQSLFLEENRTTLAIREAYRFPFRIVLDANTFPYKGRLADIFYTLEINIEPEKQAYKQLKRRNSKNAISLLGGTKKYSYSRAFDFEETSTNYTIKDRHSYFIMQPTFRTIGICTILWGLLYVGIAFVYPNLFNYFPLGFLIAYFLGVFTNEPFVKLLMGNFKIAISQENQEQFLSVIESNNNWRFFSKATLHYEIVEQYIGLQNDSNNYYTPSEQLYSSKLQGIPLSYFSRTHKHQFPKQRSKIPAIDNSVFAIKWRMVLEMTTSFGLGLTYKAVFR